MGLTVRSHECDIWRHLIFLGGTPDFFTHQWMTIEPFLRANPSFSDKAHMIFLMFVGWFEVPPWKLVSWHLTRGCSWCSAKQAASTSRNLKPGTDPGDPGDPGDTTKMAMFSGNMMTNWPTIKFLVFPTFSEHVALLESLSSYQFLSLGNKSITNQSPKKSSQPQPPRFKSSLAHTLHALLHVNLGTGSWPWIFKESWAPSGEVGNGKSPKLQDLASVSHIQDGKCF